MCGVWWGIPQLLFCTTVLVCGSDLSNYQTLVLSNNKGGIFWFSHSNQTQGYKPVKLIILIILILLILLILLIILILLFIWYLQVFFNMLPSVWSVCCWATINIPTHKTSLIKSSHTSKQKSHIPALQLQASDAVFCFCAGNNLGLS